LTRLLAVALAVSFALWPQVASSAPADIFNIAALEASDALVVSHVHDISQTWPGQSMTLVDVMDAKVVSQSGTSTVTAPGTFSPVTLSSTVALSIDNDAWRAALGTFPGETTGLSLGLVTGPGAKAGLPIGPPLFSGDGQLNQGVQQLGTESYGDPFDPSWPILTFSDVSSFPVTSYPGKPAMGLLANEIWGFQPLVGSAYASTPPIGLVKHPTLNGKPIDDAFVASDTGTPYTIAAELPPGVDRFYVQIWELLPDGSAQRTLRTIASEGASVTVPAEALPATGYFLFSFLIMTDPSAAIGSLTVTGKFRLAPAADSSCGDGVVDPAKGEVCDPLNSTGVACLGTCAGPR
jgi:hypothetical protein